jgi:hypothetical protein
VTIGILDVDNVECTGVALTVDKSANTTSVATTSDQDLGANVELDGLCDLARSEVNLDGIAGSDGWVWVADGATIVSHGNRDTLDCKQANTNQP